MAAILQIVIEESNRSIEKAYAEGYKSGIMEYKPLYDYYRNECEKRRRSEGVRNLKYSLIGAGIGICVGSATGTMLTIHLTK